MATDSNKTFLNFCSQFNSQLTAALNSCKLTTVFELGIMQNAQIALNFVNNSLVIFCTLTWSFNRTGARSPPIPGKSVRGQRNKNNPSYAQVAQVV